jgi:hypothetical protein
MAFLFFTFLVLLFAFYQWQFYMVFTPTYHKEREFGEHSSLLAIYTEDGVELEGAIYEPKEPLSTLLVFVGRSHDAVALINKLSQAYPSLRIVAFNYRSYGKSGGKINEKNMLSDGLKIAELVQKNYGDFYILGYSLGTNIAAYVASKKSTKGLFLVGAFDSIASLAKSKFIDRSFFPMINLSKIFRYKFRTGKYVALVNAKTYLFVSKSDAVTYIENARVLQKKVKNLEYYRELDGLSHKEILWDRAVIDKINEVIKNETTTK